MYLRLWALFYLLSLNLLVFELKLKKLPAHFFNNVAKFQDRVPLVYIWGFGQQLAMNIQENLTDHPVQLHGLVCAKRSQHANITKDTKGWKTKLNTRSKIQLKFCMAIQLVKIDLSSQTMVSHNIEDIRDEKFKTIFYESAELKCNSHAHTTLFYSWNT